ncbi:hypothetical protein Tco_1095424, partial [Tanacetum coccineum]
TQFKEFFESKEVNALDVPNKKWQDSFNDGATLETCLVNEGRALDDNLLHRLAVPKFIPTDDPIACLNKAMAFMSTGQNVASMGSKEKILLVHAHESGQVLDVSSSSYDNDTVSEVHPNMFEIMFAHGI